MAVSSDLLWIFLEILIICFAVVIRCYIGFKTKIGQDTWAHLLVADILRQKKRLPESIENFIYEGPYGYPPFIHILLAIIPHETAERYAWVIPGIIDSIHICLLATVCYFLTGNPAIAVLASFLLAASWISVRESISLNTRSLGSLIFSCSILPIILFSVTQNVFFAILGIVFGVLLLFTHKLASQALFCTLAGFAMLEFNPLYLIIAGCIFIGAALVPGGGYLKRILPEHIAIVTFWHKHMDQYHEREAHVYKPTISITVWSKVLSLLEIGKKIIAYGSWILLVLLIIAMTHPVLSGIQIKFLYWMIILFVCFLAFDFVPPLKLFGEGSRYLETALFPAITLLSVLILENRSNILIDTLFICCITASLCIICIQQSSIVKQYSRIGYNPALSEIFDYVKNGKGEGVMCIPYNFAFMTAYFTTKKVFYAFSALAYEKAYPEALFGSPLEKPLDVLIKKYGISYVIIDTSYFNIGDLQLGMYRQIMEKERYVLVEITG